jgi:hypothetical protein
LLSGIEDLVFFSIAAFWVVQLRCCAAFLTGAEELSFVPELVS